MLDALRGSGAVGADGGADAVAGQQFRWLVTPADSLVTSAREWGALSRLGGLPLLAPLLHPDRLLAPAAAGGDAAGGGSGDAAGAAAAAAVPQRMWPAELSDAVADAGFNAYLRSR